MRLIRRFLLQPVSTGFIVAMLALPAQADMPASVLQDPQVRAAMSAPGVQKAIEALRRNDGAAGARYLRGPANAGNPMAQVMLGRLYADGKGVPRDYKMALRWLVPVLQKGQEPFHAMVLDGLKDVIAVLSLSPREDERKVADFLKVMPALMMLPKGALAGRGTGDGSSLAGHMMMHNFMEGGDPFGE